MTHDFPPSIRDINKLSTEEKQTIYRTIIPDWVWTDFEIDPETATDHGHIRYLCPAGSRAMELGVRLHPADRDPILYLNMADTFNNQLLVLLVVVNDPKAERYNVDVDEHGNRTNYGTTGRNIAAELAAMRAGLSPGQIRAGLRAFRRSVPVFEQFVERMGHDLFLIEPLAYHNAIVFERYGFNYIRGLADMKEIHKEFLEGGDFYRKLDDSNPFRMKSAWNSVRGRSWAIHDGILGHPFTGFQMYKRIGRHAGIETFPDATW
jgi:hypothetical protein